MIFSDATQVMDLLSPIINLYKPFDSRYAHKKDYVPKIKDLPDFYPNYKTACKYAERIRIHSETGNFPEDLFLNRYPNQTDKEFDYMKSNYKQNTLPVFVDFISTMTRPFSDGNWDIKYNPEDDGEDTFQGYVENDIEVVGSLKEYVKGLLPSLKAVDANGVIAVRPEKIFVIRNEETDEVIIDDTQRVNPQPYYYPVKQVLTDTKYDDDYFILESDEKSLVEYGGQKVKKGHVFEIHDEMNIWRAVQVGKFTDYKFEIDIYYSHGGGMVMAQRLKGIPQYLNGSYLWQSPFLFACDLLDLALMNAAYLQCSVAQRMFPYLVMLGSPCEHKETMPNGVQESCRGGKIFYDGILRDCPACHGSGMRDRLSHMGVLKVNPGGMEPGSDAEVKSIANAMYYVEPPTQSAEFVQNKIEMDLAKAYEVIKAKRSSQASGQGIDPTKGTATKEILDQKASFAAVKLFNDQQFDTYDFLVFAIGWQRYASSFKKPNIIRATSFDFNTEQDYLDKLVLAEEAGAPPVVISRLLYAYLKNTYFNDGHAEALFNLVSATDMLWALTKDDILMKFNKGLIEPWQIILHDSADQIIDELVEENKDARFCDKNDCTSGFFALPFEDQQEQLIKRSQEKAAVVKQSQPQGTSLLDRARLALPANGNA